MADEARLLSEEEEDWRAAARARNPFWRHADENLALMKRLAATHEIELTFADSYLVELNGLDAYLNRSVHIGGDSICIGIYEDGELKLLSFFHELGHCVDPRVQHESKYDQEHRAWHFAYRLSESEGFSFSPRALRWAREQLATYEK